MPRYAPALPVSGLACRGLLVGTGLALATGVAVATAGAAGATPVPGGSDTAPSDWLQDRMTQLDQQVKTLPAPPPAAAPPVAQDTTEPITAPDATVTSGTTVTPDTTAATGLTAPTAPTVAAAAGGTAAQRMIATAKSQLGQGEAADGTSSYGRWYDGYTRQKGFAGAAWCDMFLGWASATIGQTAATGVFAYTPSHASWFAKKGRFDRTPRPGDFVFYDWGGSRSINAIDHIGLVTAVNPDGSITTVEGNVSNKVVTRKRTLGNVVGFGHPAYTG
ncbi:CHAP domain-containing protein [Actinomadura hibisca]|uniref:CHAP domain-containing protein n=1 Tax=Actinomadura hibisca TaxID=68565 RepID=UPI00082FDC2F|nr:CHAP domain-containing protein [Actinomadura hibisca]